MWFFWLNKNSFLNSKTIGTLDWSLDPGWAKLIPPGLKVPILPIAGTLQEGDGKQASSTLALPCPNQPPERRSAEEAEWQVFVH